MQRVFKDWITSLTGVAIVLVACGMAFTGKATWGEVTPILTFAIPFFFMKDPDKNSGGATMFLFMLLIQGSIAAVVITQNWLYLGAAGLAGLRFVLPKHGSIACLGLLASLAFSCQRGVMPGPTVVLKDSTWTTVRYDTVAVPGGKVEAVMDWGRMENILKYYRANGWAPEYRWKGGPNETTQLVVRLDSLDQMHFACETLVREIEVLQKENHTLHGKLVDFTATLEAQKPRPSLMDRLLNYCGPLAMLCMVGVIAFQAIKSKRK